MDEKQKDIHNIETELISLKEASQTCGYTVHHLGLLCRTGKLKSSRHGKQWFTSREWIDEYQKELESFYKSQSARMANKDIRKVRVIKEDIHNIKTKSDPVEFDWDKELLGDTNDSGIYIDNLFNKFSFPKLSFAFAVFMLIFTFGHANVDGIKSTFKELGSSYAELGSGMANLFDGTKQLAQVYAEIPEALKSDANVLKSDFLRKSDFVKLKLAEISFPKPKHQLAGFYQTTKDTIDTIRDFVRSLFKTPGPAWTVKMPETKEPSQQTQTQTLSSDTTNLEQEMRFIKNEIAALKNLPLNIQHTTVEKYIATITQQDLDNLNSELKSQILNQVENLKVLLQSEINKKTGGNFQAIALTQKIDNLTSPTISSPSISGTATLNFLSVTNGASISGNLSVVGDLTVAGAQSYSGLSSFSRATSTQHTISDYLWIGDEDSDNLDIRAGNWALTSTATTTVAMTNGLNFDSGTFVIDPNSGRVGIGTSSPSQALSVLGHCVTGDSVLQQVEEISNLSRYAGSRVARKSQISNQQFKTKNLRVQDVKGGEKILSLDEKIGEITSAKIQKLWDMGVKPIYKLTTEDGKTIRTTAEHPYLARLPARQVNTTKKSAEMTDLWESQSKTISSESTPNYRLADTENLSRAVGDNHNADSLGDGPAGNRTPEILVSTQNSSQTRPITGLSYQNNIQNAIWTKVIYLQEGDEIAVVKRSFLEEERSDGKRCDLDSCEETDITFVKIAKIEILPAEQVYDLSIEGTHNFVANGIVAHNTYLDGNITGTGLATFANSTTTLSTITTLWPTDVYGFTLQGAIAANSQNITGISALKGGYESFL